jgi:catechol 2,3-dioxygenase-like lactoylglutathione lyase family enzyme
MIKASGIDHVVLHVGDVNRSRRFYMDLFGMTVEHESPGHLFLRCGGQLFAIFQAADDFEAGIELNHLAFSVEEGTFEEITAELKGKGIQVSGRSDNDRCIYFHDPDGYLLQIVVPDGD